MKIFLFEFFPIDLDDSVRSAFVSRRVTTSHHFTGDEQLVGFSTCCMNRGETAFAEDVGDFVVLQTDR